MEFNQKLVSVSWPALTSTDGFTVWIIMLLFVYNSPFKEFIQSRFDKHSIFCVAHGRFIWCENFWWTCMVFLLDMPPIKLGNCPVSFLSAPFVTTARNINVRTNGFHSPFLSYQYISAYRQYYSCAQFSSTEKCCGDHGKKKEKKNNLNARPFIAPFRYPLGARVLSTFQFFRMSLFCGWGC